MYIAAVVNMELDLLLLPLGMHVNVKHNYRKHHTLYLLLYSMTMLIQREHSILCRDLQFQIFLD